jgi:hypothetical protein
VFVDADSWPCRELFGDVAQAIDSRQYLGGGRTVLMEPLPLWARLATRGWNDLSRRRRLMAGSFVFCGTAAFGQLGGFNLDLYVSEEIDFSHRLRRLARERGKDLVILSAHPLRTSSRKLQFSVISSVISSVGLPAPFLPIGVERETPFSGIEGLEAVVGGTAIRALK